MRYIAARQRWETYQRLNHAGVLSIAVTTVLYKYHRSVVVVADIGDCVMIIDSIVSVLVLLLPTPHGSEPAKMYC